MFKLSFRASGKNCDKRGPVIVISGPPGAGKSTYARRLADDLGLRYYSSGLAFRAIARERGIDLSELNRLAEGDPSIDFEIEKKTLEVSCEGGVVIDSHAAAWMIADRADILIYVKAPLLVRAERIAGRDGKSLEGGLEEIMGREESHWTRFKKYYGIDILDLSIFHLIIDTSIYDVEEAYNIIKTAVEIKLRSANKRSNYNLSGNTNSA